MTLQTWTSNSWTGILHFTGRNHQLNLAFGFLSLVCLAILGCNSSSSNIETEQAANETVRSQEEFQQTLVGEWTVKTVFDRSAFRKAANQFNDPKQRMIFEEQVAFLEQEALEMSIRPDGTYSVVDPASESRDDGVWRLGLTQGDEFILETQSNQVDSPEDSLFRIVDENTLEELPGEEEIVRVGLEFRYVLERR